MITVKVFVDSFGNHKGFESTGHAGYAEDGFDIVCSAVSMLEFNTVNAIDQLTEDGDKLVVFTDDEDGEFSVSINGELSTSGKLLMDALVLGFNSIRQEYDKYIDLIIEEV